MTAKVDNMGINGIPVQGVSPALLTSQTGGGIAPLLNAAFETNPISGLCDQRVKVTTQPVEICYDAVSNDVGNQYAMNILFMNHIC